MGFLSLASPVSRDPPSQKRTGVEIPPPPPRCPFEAEVNVPSENGSDHLQKGDLLLVEREMKEHRKGQK